MRDVRIRLLAGVTAAFALGAPAGALLAPAGLAAHAPAPAVAASTATPPTEPPPSDPAESTVPATSAPDSTDTTTLPTEAPTTTEAASTTAPPDASATTANTPTASTVDGPCLTADAGGGTSTPPAGCDPAPVPPATANPSLPGACGMSVTLVVDRSAAVGGAEADVRATVSAVVDALVGTGASVGLVDFAGGARQRIGATALDDASRGAFDDYVAAFTAGGATNWDDGLAVAGTADLILVVTGGAPDANGAVEAHGGHDPAAAGEEPLHFAVQHANAIKAGGSRIYVAGVGGADASALAAISGSSSGSDVATSDYTTAVDPGALGASLAELAGSCAAVEAAAEDDLVVTPLAVTDYSNAAPITVTSPPSGGGPQPASPYPSDITVSGLTGLVTDVNVHLYGLSHVIANDLDILLVAPGGRNILLMSDPGGVTTAVGASNATITFDDSAATGVPNSGQITGTVSYRPTDNDVGATDVDAFPPPAPAPSTNTTLAAAFTGIDPNGTWSLYIVDDTDGDNGSLSGGWSLTITDEVAAAATATTVTSSPNPSTTGANVTFTATVTSGGAPVTTGTVAFTEGTTTLPGGGAVALDGSGQATLTTSSLAEGSHLITATYSGATGLLTSNGSVTQVVDTPTSTPAAGTWCNTGPITVANSGPATPYPSRVTVSGVTGLATLVTVDLGGVGHTAPIDLDVLLVGPGGQSLVLISDVGGPAAATGVRLTFSDSAAGTIPAGGPLVTGTYRPSDNDSESQETFPAPAPAPGSATTLATFNGVSPNGVWQLFVLDDASGDAGSIGGGWCLDISTAAPTTTTLTSSGNPSDVGQPVTFTATVASGGSPVTAGSVTFAVDGGAGTAVSLDSSGQATLTTSDLAEGSHTITAAYGGAAAFQPSTAAPLTQVVRKAATVTALTSSPNPSTSGQSVTFTATVTSAGVLVTEGSVTFAIDGGAGTAVPLDGTGQARLSTSTLTVGTHDVVASYGGTTLFAPSSDDLDQVVNVAPTVTALTSSVNPSAVGEPVTFTATVTSAGAPVPAGTVTFADDGTALGAPMTLDASGQATLTTSALTVGNHAISATYSGTAQLATSSGVLTQVVGAVTADAGGPYTIDEGDGLALDGSASVARAGATYSWDVNGDGTLGDATGPSPTLTWAQLEALGITDGTGAASTLTLQVADGPTVDTAEAELTVDNVAPTASLDGDGPVPEGSTATVTFTSVDDPSADDLAALTYGYDFDNDGVFEFTSPSPSAIVPAEYLADGPSTRTVRGVVADDDGGTTELTTDIEVTNAAATATIEGPTTAVVGEPVTIKVGAVDASPADMAGTFEYGVDWGDGGAPVMLTGPSDPPVTHTYTAPGTYTVTATATDPDGATSEPATFTIRVSAQPTTTTSAPATTTTSEPATTSTTAPATGASSTTTAGGGDDGLAGTGGGSGWAVSAGVALLSIGLVVLGLSRWRVAARR